MTVDVARVVFAGSEYRKTAPLVDSSVLTADALATELEFTTLLSNESDANAFRSEILAVRQVGLYDWEVSVRRDSYSWELGDTITVKYPRFGLDNGADFIVKGIKKDQASNFISVTLYGPRTKKFFFNGTMPSGATFTRASSGSYNDSVGRLLFAANDTPRWDYDVSQARYNMQLNSQQLDTGVIFQNSGVTVTADQTTAPDGTTTADFVKENATTGPHSLQFGTQSTIVNGTYTVSVYAKAGTRSMFMLYGLGGDGKGRGFDLVNGITVSAGVPDAIAYGMTAVGNGWYRCWITMNTSLHRAVRLGAIYMMSAAGVNSYAGDGSSGMYFWGVQVEPGASMTGYLATTTYQVAAPTFRGLLLEPAATNTALQASTIDNALWAPAGLTSKTANYANGPTGTATAERLLIDTTNNIHYVNQFVTQTGQSAISGYVKPLNGRYFYIYSIGRSPNDGTNQPIVVFDLSTLTVLSSASPGNFGIELAAGGFYRFWCTGTSASAQREYRFGLSDAASSQVFTGNGTDDFLVYGFQVESGTAPTSYIDTTSAAVTRAADVLVLNWASKGIQDGTVTIRYTFDDGSYQDVSTVVSGGNATVPTNLNRKWIVSAEKI